MKKIFYDPSLSKWRCFEAPEKPTYRYDLKIWREYDAYEKAYAEAKENALEVGNPEIMRITTVVYKDGLIDWPGSAVIRDNKYYLSL